MREREAELFPISAPSLSGYHHILTADAFCLDAAGLLRITARLTDAQIDCREFPSKIWFCPGVTAAFSYDHTD